MMIGKKFGNRYEIIEKLGSGGMSIVYKGLDTLLNRWVTIKVLREQFASDEDFVRRFHREAQSVASLSHINIVSIYDVGFELDLHYLVMEYVEGRNLKEYIREQGKLTPEEAVPIAIQILHALEHAHEHHVVHRDIKPHNILLTMDGRVKVTDFGIARVANEATMTYSGTMVGSVQYISPEQAKGLSVGPKSDLYSAGVVLYEMLTGHLPFEGESPIAVALQHIQEEPPSPSALVEDIPMELSHVILKAMEKNPDLRYASADAMAFDLEKIYTGKSHEINMIKEKQNLSEDTVEIPAVRSGNGSPEGKKIPEEEKTPPPKKKKLKPQATWGIIGAAVLIFLLLGWGAYALLTGFFNVGEARMPDMRGKSLIEAKAELKEAGLEHTLTYSFHDTIKKDHVISQTIEPNQMVKKTNVVGLVISNGPKTTRVPNVVGKTQREAVVELNNRNLQGDFSEAFDDRVPAGTVISQQPEAGVDVPEKTMVTVVVSKGKELKYLPMPDLLNKYLDEAEKILKDLGLSIGKAEERESNEYFPSQIMSQEIKAGDMVLEGDKVNVQVSSGPGPMAQMARVTYDIPPDGETHRLRIIVSDLKGERTEYDRVHQPGDFIDQQVPFFGKGKIDVYVDDELGISENVP
ncbi:Stk1 family PASTA domain-containing Ser/Thr kinase [Dehalobacterium formicoaceticum]|uniref:non-specific serine/threonine protein kinase n=1 Tax=Dehalobacterium formicoaceticum TaxID=51515 RepID=A0ABT1Y402_9FIRM|nr:Stk1 family PASTA domain-containing Ser/Thr kinase [Dehalobacterium formicoaceticum]MCR6544644.1 Stk1 family PASTA domain-containing Ser/Thr kinase [Dehalobacterium formicoaceticum]